VRLQPGRLLLTGERQIVCEPCIKLIEGFSPGTSSNRQ
jgi:hypothetical protein